LNAPTRAGIATDVRGDAFAPFATRSRELAEQAREPRRAKLPARHAPLVPVLAVAALFNTYALARNGYANTFYSAAVKSMLRSLHNFLFVSFDPGGLVSVDKPPLALWLQAASAKLFGFSPLALLLPEALAGVLAVAALYWAMARSFGRPAALAAALTLAISPSFVAVARDNGPDPLLILLMTLACVAALRAIRGGRLRALLSCALLIALAFNTKTLAAYLVVPPVALAFLVCAPGPLRRRVAQLAVAGLALVAVSVAWLAFVDLTPPSQRPYAGGSTDNSELGLTFAYNGIGRVGGEEGDPGKIPFRPGASVVTLSKPEPVTPRSIDIYPALGRGRPTQIRSEAGAVGALRLLDSDLGAQGGWMLPFALVSLLALVASLLAARGAHTMSRRDPRLAGVLVLGGWFLLEATVLSLASGIVHPYYVSALAPGTAAMVGAGAALFAKLARRRDRLALLLPVAVAATSATQIVLLERERYLAWLPVVLAAAAALLPAIALWPQIGSTATRLTPTPARHAHASVAAPARARRSTMAVALMLGLLLLAPGAYATTTWLAPVEGTFPAAGPRAAAGPGGFGLYGIAEPRTAKRLVRYLSTHHPGGRYSVLAVSSVTAAPLILMGSRAAALGGYSGDDPALDGAGLARLVARGEARYVLLGGAYSERGGNRASAAVLSACRRLAPRVWGGPPLRPYSLVLFDCAGRERALARD